MPDTPKNDFLPFGIETGANVLKPEDYDGLTARKTGFVSGVAKSEELNTVWRQASVIAATFAQYIVDRTGKDVLDDGDMVALLQLTKEALNSVQSIGAGDKTYQPDADGKVTLGSAAGADIVTSMTDTTAGRVLVAGSGGFGGYALQTTDAEIQSQNRLPTRFFTQGEGDADKRFGRYGAGVHIEYGTDGNGVEFSANMFVRADGNIIVEWLQVNADGSVNLQNRQMLYGPLNPPTAAQTGAMPLDSKSLDGKTDLNTLGAYASTGIHYQTLNASATTANHYPTAAAGTLFVTPSAYGCQQMYITYSNRIFVRALTGAFTGTGPWNDWVEIPSLDTADGRYLKSAGGKLTGNLEIADNAPIIQLTETDTGKKYFIVTDGSGFRINEDSTVGNNVLSYAGTSKQLKTDGQFVPKDYANFDSRYLQTLNLANTGAVGTLALLCHDTKLGLNATAPGSALFYSGFGAQRDSYGDLATVSRLTSPQPTGTWKCLGVVPAPNNNDRGAALFCRIA